MKTRLLTGLVLTLFILLGVQSHSSAQITGVSIDSLQTWGGNGIFGGCNLPDTAFVSLMGHATGTAGTNDSITIDVDFGDGTDSTWTQSLYANQNYFWGYLFHVYQFPGTYSVLVTATTSNSITSTLYANTLTYSNSCANVSGDLYMDANNNCVKDAGEQELSWGTVVITSTAGTYYTIADASGHYAIDLPTGYTYTLTPNFYWAGATPTCPTSGSATVTTAPGGSYVSNFAYTCSSAPIDYAVYAYASNWRPGFNRTLSITAYGNNICGTLPATITVTLPPLLTYSGAIGTLPAPTVSGSTLTWTVPSLSVFNSFYSAVNIMTDPGATLGDTICVTATITTSPADANPANNSYTICRTVSNSWDPNDKSVAPTGTGTAGNIPNGTQLTYLVNFQNTGNDVAYNVTVKDLIDEDLDLSTLKVLRTSHNMQVGIVDREVNFRFDNINLPDSTTNEPASHGYILYTIQPKASLPLGTEINNTADIYFDYNDAIVTNTTLNTIAAPQGIEHISNGTIEATVYPNPANGNVYVDVSDKAAFEAALYDVTGRSVKVAQGNNGRAVMSVKEVPAGIYILRLTDADGKVLITKLNIQH